MSLKPIGIVKLLHRAFYISRAGDHFAFAVASEDGHITKFDREFVPRSIGLDCDKIRSISLNRSGDLLAIAHDQRLTIVDVDGSPIYSDEAPQLREHSTSLNGESFDDCFFDPIDDHLWSVAVLSTGQIELQIREPEIGPLRTKRLFDDPYGCSSCSFHVVPKSNTVALWVAAGQDGQQVYWLSRAGELGCTLEPTLEDTTPPDFSPNGDEFLVLNEQQTVCRFTFPNVHEIGQCHSHFDEEEDGFGCSVRPTSIIITP